MNYSSIPEFNKDFAKLKKKFRTLDDDFKILKSSHIELLHIHKIQTDDPVKIENFCSASYESYKVKKFACKALKNKGVRSGLRVIYVFEPQLEKITFIEIYFKADKEVENKERLKSFTAIPAASKVPPTENACYSQGCIARWQSMLRFLCLRRVEGASLAMGYRRRVCWRFAWLQ